MDHAKQTETIAVPDTMEGRLPSDMGIATTSTRLSMCRRCCCQTQLNPRRLVSFELDRRPEFVLYATIIIVRPD